MRAFVLGVLAALCFATSAAAQQMPLDLRSFQVPKASEFKDMLPRKRAVTQRWPAAEKPQPVRLSVPVALVPTGLIACPSHMEPGTIAVVQHKQKLCFMDDDGVTTLYSVSTGRSGFTWTGVQYITRKVRWPDWTPPAAMLKRQPHLPRYMAGGPGNPLGAAALYLGQTEYRIHGTSDDDSIGYPVSSGCIRMKDQDVLALYERVRIGTRVVVIK